MRILPINSCYTPNYKVQNCHKNNTAFKGEFINAGPIESFMYEAINNDRIADVYTFKNLLECMKTVNDNMLFWLENRTLYKQQKNDAKTKEVLAVFGSYSEWWQPGDYLILNKVNKALETFYEDRLSSENGEYVIDEIMNKLLIDKNNRVKPDKKDT